ncbi:ORF102 [Ranid herpesvirus 1]|uniref:ORF102 n=1 Tax=Ranid herpesvirus 1 TaxID=85655 RepID=Q14VM8_9VIRU|nr:ORF102 [Ranid herpesvirus 1]ABG25746.1 ORF102 [Ranid herpesvirus 1]
MSTLFSCVCTSGASSLPTEAPALADSTPPPSPLPTEDLTSLLSPPSFAHVGGYVPREGCLLESRRPPVQCSVKEHQVEGLARYNVKEPIRLGHLSPLVPGYPPQFTVEADVCALHTGGCARGVEVQTACSRSMTAAQMRKWFMEQAPGKEAVLKDADIANYQKMCDWSHLDGSASGSFSLPYCLGMTMVMCEACIHICSMNKLSPPPSVTLQKHVEVAKSDVVQKKWTHRGHYLKCTFIRMKEDPRRVHALDWVRFSLLLQIDLLRRWAARFNRDFGFALYRCRVALAIFSVVHEEDFQLCIPRKYINVIGVHPHILHLDLCDGTHFRYVRTFLTAFHWNRVSAVLQTGVPLENLSLMRTLKVPEQESGEVTIL